MLNILVDFWFEHLIDLSKKIQPLMSTGTSKRIEGHSLHYWGTSTPLKQMVVIFCLNIVHHVANHSFVKFFSSNLCA